MHAIVLAHRIPGLLGGTSDALSQAWGLEPVGHQLMANLADAAIKRVLIIGDEHLPEIAQTFGDGTRWGIPVTLCSTSPMAIDRATASWDDQPTLLVHDDPLAPPAVIDALRANPIASRAIGTDLDHQVRALGWICDSLSCLIDHLSLADEMTTPWSWAVTTTYVGTIPPPWRPGQWAAWSVWFHQQASRRRLAVWQPSTTGVLVSASAQIDPSAELVAPCLIGDGAIVQAGARIGPRAVIGTGALVGEQAVVEDGLVTPDTVLSGGARVRDGVADHRLCPVSERRVACGPRLRPTTRSTLNERLLALLLIVVLLPVALAGLLLAFAAPGPTWSRRLRVFYDGPGRLVRHEYSVFVVHVPRVGWRGWLAAPLRALGAVWWWWLPDVISGRRRLIGAPVLPRRLWQALDEDAVQALQDHGPGVLTWHRLLGLRYRHMHVTACYQFAAHLPEHLRWRWGVWQWLRRTDPCAAW